MGLIVPIFISHQGCPHQCLFCNQRAIGGPASSIETSQIETEIKVWLARSGGTTPAEVAFYGGSFTCLDEEEQRCLLKAVQPFIEAGRVDRIRLSTRPDCVSGENSRMLTGFGVRTVELGVQSLDDRVLAAAERGHTADHSRRAIATLKAAGLEVGVQLLPGLPGETSRSFVAGVREVIRHKPALVRLYPAVVVAGSPLAELYRQNRYRPLSLNRAIALCRRAWELCAAAGIPVVRMGLQPSATLASQVLAGPYHPAFGELVISRHWLRQLRRRLAELGPDQHLRVYISQRDHSALVGMKKVNSHRLAQLGFAHRYTIIPERTRERGTVEYAVC